jgi:hypothetical protein
MTSCCANTIIESTQHVIYVEDARYVVKLVYCKNCKSLKATSSIRHEK